MTRPKGKRKGIHVRGHLNAIARALLMHVHVCIRSRGVRYDNQNMSRLMDVVGDGKDIVRMCIDATHFSNLGRFARAFILIIATAQSHSHTAEQNATCHVLDF